MAKSLKKPKMLKKPKSPRATAPLTVWERHQQRVLDVAKKNALKLKAYNEKKSAMAKAASKKAQIQKTVSGLGVIPKGR